MHIHGHAFEFWYMILAPERKRDTGQTKRRVGEREGENERERDTERESEEYVLVSRTWVKCTNFHVSVRIFNFLEQEELWLLLSRDRLIVLNKLVESRDGGMSSSAKQESPWENGTHKLFWTLRAISTGHLICQNKSHELNQQQEYENLSTENT